MINKFFNWVFGSFFRTAGRFLFYFLIMLLISFLIHSCEAKASTSINANWGAYSLNNDEIFISAGDVSPYYAFNIDYVGDGVDCSGDTGCVANAFDTYDIPSAWNSNANNRAFLFYRMSYCSSHDWEVFDHGDYITQDIGYTENQTCKFADGNSGKVSYLYFRMKLTALNIGSGGLATAIYESHNVSRFKNPISEYGIRIKFRSLELLTSEEYLTNIENLKERTELNGRLNEIDSAINNVTNYINNTNNKLDATNDKLDKTNENLNKVDESINNMNDSITSTEGADLGALENSAGWLPAGPVDSILNLPLSLMNNLTTNLNKSCSPLVVPLPFIDKDLTIPCLNTIYENISGLNVWITTISIIASGFILYSYFLKLYKWVEDTLMFNDNSGLSSWGGV